MPAKDRRSVCPECGSEKFAKLRRDRTLSKGKEKPILPRLYYCNNGHRFFTGDAIPKYKFRVNL